VTIVQNTVTDPAGNPVALAAVRIALIAGTVPTTPGYTATGDIIGVFSTQSDLTGKWSANLTPNTAITPANTYYQITENAAASTIVVPASGGPYNLSQILSAPPPTPAAPGITGVQVAAGGTVAGSRPTVNLIAGTGIAVTATDNPGANRVDAAISANPVAARLKHNYWYPMDGGGGNRTMTYNLLWLYPFDAQVSAVMQALGINVTTPGSAGTLIRCGVYSSDGAGGVGGLLLDAGTLAGDSGGVKSVALNQAVNPDRLWLGAVWQGTNNVAPVLQAYTRPAPYLGWTSFYQFPSIVGYQYNAVSGVLPASLGAPASPENSNCPAVQFQV
jgi:hypothetical protein